MFLSVMESLGFLFSFLLAPVCIYKVHTFVFDTVEITDKLWLLMLLFFIIIVKMPNQHSLFHHQNMHIQKFLYQLYDNPETLAIINYAMLSN